MDRKRGIHSLPWIALGALLCLLAGIFFLIHYNSPHLAVGVAVSGVLIFFSVVLYSLYKYLEIKFKESVFTPLFKYLRLKIVITFGLAAAFLSLFITTFYFLSRFFSVQVFIEYFHYYIQFPALLFQLAAAAVGICSLLICLVRMLVKHLYLLQLTSKN